MVTAPHDVPHDVPARLIGRPQPGHRVAMSQNPEEPPALDLSEVANEPGEESIAEEQDIVGDEPGGDTVPEDSAQ